MSEEMQISGDSASHEEGAKGLARWVEATQKWKIIRLEEMPWRNNHGSDLRKCPGGIIMARYLHQDTLVEYEDAFQWSDNFAADRAQWPQWLRDAADKEQATFWLIKGGGGMCETIYGTESVNGGDWILRDKEDRVYVAPDDEFMLNFALISEDE